jgi:hypothetical protein
MKIFTPHPTLASTPFSDFFRNASSGEKKRVYEQVLKRATERQQSVIKKAKASE